MIKRIVKFIYASVSGKKYPLSVGIQITNRCNQRCVYCSYPENSYAGEIDSAEWIKIIGNMALSGVKAVSISGGEPMLKEGILDVISFCRKKGLYILFGTNGYGVKENLGTLSLVDNIGISLDGAEDAHDRLRGAGSYARAVGAILACRGMKMNVSHGMVVNKLNFDQVDHVLKFAKDNKTSAAFQIMEFNPTKGSVSKNWKNREDIGDIQLGPKEIKEVFSRLAARKKEGYPILNSRRFLKSVADWAHYPDLYNSDRMKGVRCAAGRHFCFIYPDGTVFACNMFHRNGIKIKDGDFSQAFYDLKKEEKCESCLLPCHLERNLLFAMDIESAASWLNSSVIRKWNV